jgi:uncharacterized protein YcbX
MPAVHRITLYPVKSLDGHDVEAALVLPAGALEHDRRWRLVDDDGAVVNGKRCPILAAIRAVFDLDCATVALRVDPAAVAAAGLPAADRTRLRRLAADSDPAAVPLVPGAEGPCGWLSEAVGRRVFLQERLDGGFPDDTDAPGPTVVSEATLAAVGRWFGLDTDEVRRRFRANVEIVGCDAFWEDTLASAAAEAPLPSLASLPDALPVDPYANRPPPEPRAFHVGGVRFRATNVCRRCPVPGRDSRTAVVTPHFRDAFEAWRRRELRADVDACEWGQLYRLAVNTRLEGPGGGIGVGAVVTVE